MGHWAGYFTKSLSSSDDGTSQVPPSPSDQRCGEVQGGKNCKVFSLLLRLIHVGDRTDYSCHWPEIVSIKGGTASTDSQGGVLKMGSSKGYNSWGVETE